MCGSLSLSRSTFSDSTTTNNITLPRAEHCFPLLFKHYDMKVGNIGNFQASHYVRWLIILIPPFASVHHRLLLVLKESCNGKTFQPNFYVELGYKVCSMDEWIAKIEMLKSRYAPYRDLASLHPSWTGRETMERMGTMTQCLVWGGWKWTWFRSAFISSAWLWVVVAATNRKPLLLCHAHTLRTMRHNARKTKDIGMTKVRSRAVGETGPLTLVSVWLQFPHFPKLCSRYPKWRSKVNTTFHGENCVIVPLCSWTSDKIGIKHSAYVFFPIFNIVLHMRRHLEM